MNKYQRLVLIVALLDALVMVLFPPFNNVPLTRGALPSFDGFYPLLTHLGKKPIHQVLLALQLMFVAANGLVAWLLLRQEQPQDIPTFRYHRAIGLFAAVNLAIVFLFPPFEPYPSLLRQAASSGFESFYFVFGDRSQRPVFVPLLYLESVFVAVNALACWLLFNAVRRSEDAARRKVDEVAARHVDAQLGRGEDRRQQADPDYHEEERRHGERRHSNPDEHDDHGNRGHEAPEVHARHAEQP